MTLERLAEAVRDAARLRVVGRGTKSWLAPSSDRPVLDMTPWSGIIEHDVADQVVVVWAGTPIAELQQELARHGQTLPLPDPAEHGAALAGYPGTVGGLVAANLPHGRESASGSVRDWVLRATVVRPDGTMATSGSKAVKSVAGYDVHKALVGTMGSLAVFAQLTFLVSPIRALPPVTGVVHQRGAPGPVWIGRCLPSEWHGWRNRISGVVAEDSATCTVWSTNALPHPQEGWIRGPGGVTWSDVPNDALRQHAKQVFDPADKLG